MNTDNRNQAKDMGTDNNRNQAIVANALAKAMEETELPEEMIDGIKQMIHDGNSVATGLLLTNSISDKKVSRDLLYRAIAFKAYPEYNKAVISTMKANMKRTVEADAKSVNEEAISKDVAKTNRKKNKKKRTSRRVNRKKKLLYFIPERHEFLHVVATNGKFRLVTDGKGERHLVQEQPAPSRAIKYIAKKCYFLAEDMEWELSYSLGKHVAPVLYVTPKESIF